MPTLLSDLTAAGYPVQSVSALRDSGIRYRDAVPVLLSWLSRTSDSNQKEEIVRALSVPWAKSQALRPLMKEFSAEPIPSDGKGELLRWAVGNALEVLWDDSEFDELVALATDRRFGKAREMLVLGMGKSKRPDAADILIGLLDDPVVNGHAVAALGKLRPKRARPGLERMTTDPRVWVRKAATRALTRLK